MAEKMTAQQALDAAIKRGAKAYWVDYAIDLSEPLLGREARAAIGGLRGESGTFASIDSVNEHDLIALANGDAEDEELWAGLHSLLTDDEGGDNEVLVVGAPDDWTGATSTTLAFNFNNRPITPVQSEGTP